MDDSVETRPLDPPRVVSQPDRIPVILTGGLVAVHGLLVFGLPALGLSAWPISRAWGFSFAKLFPWYVIPAYVIAAAISVPTINRNVQDRFSRLNRRIYLPLFSKPWLIAFGLICLPGFWLIRQKYALLGDGYAWIDGVQGGGFDVLGGIRSVWKSYQYGLRWLTIVFQMDATHVVQIAGCLLGVPFIVFAGLFSREVSKQRLLHLRDRRISKEGVIIIKAQQYRTQEKNRQAALDRLQELILSIAVVQKARKSTRPTRNSQKRRMDSKSQRGKTKQLRGRVSDE